MTHNLRIHGHADVQRYVASLPPVSKERLLVMFLDDQFHLVEFQTVSLLSEANTERCLNNVLIAGLNRRATSFILIHNSLTLKAPVDLAEFTTAKRLQLLARELGLQLLDHLIVTA